jgi:hypothetical protein
MPLMKHAPLLVLPHREVPSIETLDLGCLPFLFEPLVKSSSLGILAMSKSTPSTPVVGDTASPADRKDRHASPHHYSPVKPDRHSAGMPEFSFALHFLLADQLVGAFFVGACARCRRQPDQHR